MPPENPEEIARQIREESQRQERDRRRREIDSAEQRGREKQELAGTLREHHEKLEALSQSVSELKKLESRMGAIEKSFGEFTAVAKALAENGVSNRTFLVGVGMLLVAIIGLFIGVAHP